MLPKSETGKTKLKPRKMEFSLIDELHHVEFSCRLGVSPPPVYEFEVGRFLPMLFVLSHQFH